MPMIPTRWVNIYGYIFLAIVVAMLALVLYGVVPESMKIPLFLVAVVLYLIRIALRLLLERQRRLQEREKMASMNAIGEETKEK
jgi:hypothetical protein